MRSTSLNRHLLCRGIDTSCTIAVVIDEALGHVNVGRGWVDTIHRQVDSVDPAARVVFSVDVVVGRTPSGAVRGGPASKRPETEDLCECMRSEVEAGKIVQFTFGGFGSNRPLLASQTRLANSRSQRLAGREVLDVPSSYRIQARNSSRRYCTLPGGWPYLRQLFGDMLRSRVASQFGTTGSHHCLPLTFRASSIRSSRLHLVWHCW